MIVRFLDDTHVVVAYSTVGGTNVLEAVSFAACGADLMFYLRKPIVEFSFLVTLSACLLQDISLLMVNPR